MPAVAGTPRYENWVRWLMEGSGVVCATHPAPSWGQAPALHFSLPSAGNEPQLEEVSWPAIPNPSGYGTCFRTNRPSRLLPAHQGMKMGVLVAWKRSGCHCPPTPLLDSRSDELRGRNDENAEWRGSTARKPRRRIFVPIRWQELSIFLAMTRLVVV